MFVTLSPAPPDPILGLTEAFKSDPDPSRINLGVGVYQDETGRTPVLPSIKAAETALIGTETTKAYLPIVGEPEYGLRVASLVFGQDRAAAASDRARLAYAPGGTGALRVGAEFMAEAVGRGRVAWVTRPTWPNHRGIFSAAGFDVRELPYFDASTSGLRRDEFLDALRSVPEGDLVVLHACCHNPTGVDLDAADWREVIAIAAERKWIPFMDSAYLGFGDGLDEDATPLRSMLDSGIEWMAAISFSKNMGLYRERVGALAVIGAAAKAADIAFSRIKKTIRTLYSNPAAHGALTAAMVLSDRMLRVMWDSELAAMRDRLHSVRAAFADGLAERMPDRDMSFIRSQRGMFSFTGLTLDQVEWLRSERHIYMTSDGRVNVVGLNDANMNAVCNAVAEAFRRTA